MGNVSFIIKIMLMTACNVYLETKCSSSIHRPITHGHVKIHCAFSKYFQFLWEALKKIHIYERSLRVDERRKHYTGRLQSTEKHASFT